MSSSSLWVMDKEYFGCEDSEFGNSWLFTPVAFDVLLWRYLPYVRAFDGGKTHFISEIMLHDTISGDINEKINRSDEQADRVLWELGNQQVFFSKDKQFVADQIRRFLEIHSDCEELRQEHIAKRFNEIADAIAAIDEQKFPFFIFKNSSCDDGVEYWFSHYNEETDEFEDSPFLKIEKYVAEFVYIENGKIVKFVGNPDYFKKDDKDA
jgi:hypothetical protein